jgi:choline dehydrogenase-like flavoprotein
MGQATPQTVVGLVLIGSDQSDVLAGNLVHKTGEGVDQYGKAHGVRNLRVADASIMPDCIRADTNVTTMMIGERIADSSARGDSGSRQ